MADQQKAQSSQGLFIIKNVVRRTSSRLRRYAAPGRQRFKQFVCGKRLLRNQSLTVTADEMNLWRTSLEQQIRAGAIQVTEPDGGVIMADHQGRMIKRLGQQVIMLEGAGRQPAPPPTPKPSPIEKVPTVEETPKAKAEPPVVEVVTESEPDDLTELPGIGGGRVKKLIAAGITTFKQVSEMLPADLAKMFNIPEDVAVGICEAAFEKVES